MKAFLADNSPDAFAKVIDRLLASPHYGERWARHWLDVARYADSNGLDENLVYRNAWRYRDYVIGAFNKDKPYDQFVKEQLAGDLLPASDDATQFEHWTATGFLSLGAKMLAEDDPVKMQMDIVDEQIDTTSRAFMGLTLGCARCHDHKFDPIPTADYYSMAGIFLSSKTMENYNVVATWHEFVLAPEEATPQAEGAPGSHHRERQRDRHVVRPGKQSPRKGRANKDRPVSAGLSRCAALRKNRPPSGAFDRLARQHCKEPARASSAATSTAKSRRAAPTLRKNRRARTSRSMT